MRDERGRSPRPSGGEPGGSPSATTGGYDASSIEVLTGLEAVRKRPVMYVGDVSSPTAVAEWVWHAVETTLQLHLDRSARSVSLSVDPTGWVEVADDGPGISAIPGVHGTTPLEIVSSALHVGHARPRWWPGTIPWACMNALSSRFEVESHHEGRLARIAYERGHLVDPAAIVGSTARSGVRLRFRADPAIFRFPTVDLAHLESRLRELAWLAPLLRVEWQGETLPGVGGLPTLVSRGGAKGVVHTTQVSERHQIDLALSWADPDAPPSEWSFRAFAREESGLALAGVWDGLLAIARHVQPALGESVLRVLLSPGLRIAIHANREPDWQSRSGPSAERRLIARLTRDLLCYRGRPSHPELLRRLG